VPATEKRRSAGPVAKLFVIIALLLMAIPAYAAEKKSCASLQKELSRLRTEYHEFASGSDKASGEISFDKLAEMLDEIIKLKQEMRDTDCKIRPRKQDIKTKR